MEDLWRPFHARTRTAQRQGPRSGKGPSAVKVRTAATEKPVTSALKEPCEARPPPLYQESPLRAQESPALTIKIPGAHTTCVPEVACQQQQSGASVPQTGPPDWSRGCHLGALLVRCFLPILKSRHTNVRSVSRWLSTAAYMLKP